VAKFSVDTHLFRELGELLVGRESTALVELIKNSYDADATEVVLHGENLDNPAIGKIVIADNGNGMTPGAFEAGFLTIASRGKDGKVSKSPRLQRRFTGAKGVGRLAAHKLAWRLSVDSTPEKSVFGKGAQGVHATIDWKAIEGVQSLDDVEKIGGLHVEPRGAPRDAPHGTRIVLSDLKKRWTQKQRNDFFGEIDSFLPPELLTRHLDNLVVGKPLFKVPLIRDESASGGGFRLVRTGDMDVGDDQVVNALNAADWVVDIECDDARTEVVVCLMPTTKFVAEFPSAVSRRFRIPAQRESMVPFQARILFQAKKSWNRPGIRIYQEGFRVLPYGEARNDWLELDEDYKKRGRNLRFLEKVPSLHSVDDDKNLGLSTAGNSSYFGAVFLTVDRSAALRMLVNREGFEWSTTFEGLKTAVRTALDLLVRERAGYTLEKRNQRRLDRKGSQSTTRVGAREARQVLEDAIASATHAGERARALAASGNQKGASKALLEGVKSVADAAAFCSELVSDVHSTRILAALGLQLSAYIHEVHGLMAMARHITELSARLRQSATGSLKTQAIQLDGRIAELSRSIEKQANYLADVTSADARRRRSRQPVRDRFQAAARLYEQEAAALGINVRNDIEADVKTPVPMFSSELMLALSNLLSNAIKAAGKGGKVVATAIQRDQMLRIRIENTGVAVDPSDGERWFVPFESGNESPDIFLGRGMGMGLPITRELLEDYGATVAFVKPKPRFSAAVEITMGVS
jgi:signal transduction histidine kinase